MVLTLLSVVSAAIGGSLIHGTKLYSRFSRALDGQDAALFYERLTHDLKNYVPFSGLPVSFASDGMTIVTTNMIKNDDLSASPDYPLMIEYRYLPERHIIVRVVSTYPYKARREETVLSGVDEALFEWKLIADNRPSFLSIAIKRAGAGDVTATLHTIGIPTGYDIATQ